MKPTKIILCLIATTALSIVPREMSAQVVVTAPQPGALSSYRTTTISWNPIPGATSYHLEIDDDPNFGSPEVDVTVPGTSYKLSGERLKLHGRHTAAAYVRINGTRWNANTFTPTYFHNGGNPALAVNSQNRVYLAFEDGNSQIQLTTSSDWSSKTRLSLADTFNTYGLNLAVDEHDVAHASWMEQRPTESWVPYYSNSSTGWNLVRIPGTIPGGCSEGSLVVGGAQIDLFYEDCNAGINHWTGTDGLVFTRTTIPNNPFANSTNAARDGFGNLYVASERYAQPLEDLHSALQNSADSWNQHRLGPGRFPSIAVTPGGVVHALRWGVESGDSGLPFFYSNSLRDFETWTELPGGGSPFFEQDLLPLVVDDTRSQLHAAMPLPDGVKLCSTPNTGQAVDTGVSWTCRKVGEQGSDPDLAVAPDGTLHLAWRGRYGVAYANSLGSFLATNLPPQVRFGASSSGPSAAILPATIFDADGDAMSGQIHVGRHAHVLSRLSSGGTLPFLYGLYTLANPFNTHISGDQLEFKPAGGTSWDANLYREQVPTLPAMVEVRLTNGATVGEFVITGWDNTGIAVGQGTFVPSMTFSYTGTLPNKVDISAVPEGDAMVAITASDGSNPGIGLHGFTKTAGQTWLVLRSGP